MNYVHEQKKSVQMLDFNVNTQNYVLINRYLFIVLKALDFQPHHILDTA